MSGCAQIAAWLPGFVGDDLAKGRLELVRAHLRDCPGCRREAASYLQANKALQAAAAAAVAEVGGADVGVGQIGVGQFGDRHDDLHVGIHAAVMARVEQAAEREASSLSWSHRMLLAAAAVLLAAFGFWLAAEPQPASIWLRAPLHVPVDDAVPRAVPHAGPRYDLRPVGLGPDSFGRPAENGYGPGMMGRGQLRSDVDGKIVNEEFVLPAVHRRFR